ncbi:3'-5' exoribonuclease YhaM family protein [Flexistipes sinusarabici]|uniref:Haloacid dehalogenase n=1 Tax=Flexistipes sinusarabici TaxID=2352 RepID=A0A3D5QE83_FLESI|nr:HD domain-containing protein [Flexistipes sinusarabici]HCW94157.1 haloacid dehalogenase [Flexistipes sinusarabici]
MNLNVSGEKYMIFEINHNVTKDSRPYIRVILTDKDGKRHNGIMFDSNKLDFTPEKGDIVSVEAVVQNYNGQIQLKISNMEKLGEESRLDFLPKTQFNIQDMFDELKEIMDKNVKEQPIRKLVKLFFGDSKTIKLFKYMPAAKNVHHAYVGGLLEHTLSVAKLAEKMCGYYKEYVNPDLLMVGALFHDIGKIFELNAEKGFDYTDSGKLVGHLLLGIELINNYIAQVEDFPENYKYIIDHMIASHHGLLEFGSPKKPKTTEAIILHHIDDMDAKVNTFNSIFEKEEVQEGWSSYDRLLERQLYRHS